MDESSRYRVTGTSRNTSDVADVVLSTTTGGERRKVIRSRLVDQNPRGHEKSVEIAIVAQRRGKGDEWTDLEGDGLNNMKAGEAKKISLDTTETYDLLKHLGNLYEVGADHIGSGKVVLEVSDIDRVLGDDAGRLQVITKLLAGDHGDEMWAELASAYPQLAERLSADFILRKRREALTEFEANIGGDRDENYWQSFLTENRWIFGTANVEIIQERRITTHHTTDIPFEVDGRFVDLVELKRPDFSFWAVKQNGQRWLYRDKYLIPHGELRGAISQISAYILEAEKRVNDIAYRDDLGGVVPLKPRGMVVHGRSDDWGEDEWKAYRLLNDELHGIQVITFDILLDRAKRALNSFAGEVGDVSSDDASDDIPF